MSKKKQKKLTVKVLKEYLAQFPDDTEVGGETGCSDHVYLRDNLDTSHPIKFIRVVVPSPKGPLNGW